MKESGGLWFTKWLLKTKLIQNRWTTLWMRGPQQKYFNKLNVSLQPFESNMASHFLYLLNSKSLKSFKLTFLLLRRQSWSFFLTQIDHFLGSLQQNLNFWPKFEGIRVRTSLLHVLNVSCLCGHIWTEHSRAGRRFTWEVVSVAT